MNAELIANGLRMEYPDIYTRLIDKLSDMVPVTDDSGDVNKIIRRYCSYHGIDREYLKASSAHRKRLLAVCILALQPEKIKGYSHRRLKNGIITAISDYAGCDKSVLQNWVSEIITHYRVYDDFRRQIDDLCVTIKI